MHAECALKMQSVARLTMKARWHGRNNGCVVCCHRLSQMTANDSADFVRQTIIRPVPRARIFHWFGKPDMSNTLRAFRAPPSPGEKRGLDGSAVSGLPPPWPPLPPHEPASPVAQTIAAIQKHANASSISVPRHGVETIPRDDNVSLPLPCPHLATCKFHAIILGQCIHPDRIELATFSVLG